MIKIVKTLFLRREKGQTYVNSTTPEIEFQSISFSTFFHFSSSSSTKWREDDDDKMMREIQQNRNMEKIEKKSY